MEIDVSQRVHVLLAFVTRAFGSKPRAGSRFDFTSCDRLMLEVVLQQCEGANDCAKENKQIMVLCTVAAACMAKAGARGHENISTV